MTKSINLFSIILLIGSLAQAATSEVYSLGELNKEAIQATVEDGSGPKLRCVADKTFFSSSKQAGTNPIRDIYRIQYRFPTLGLFGKGSDQFISVGPMAQYEGLLSSKHFETVNECKSAIAMLNAESIEGIIRRVPAQVSMSLQIRMTHFEGQNRCRRQVKEIFSLILGKAQPIKFLDILGLTQNSLSSNEAFIEITASADQCFEIPRIK